MARTGPGRRAIEGPWTRINVTMTREMRQTIESMDRSVLGLPELPKDAKRQHTSDKVRKLLELAIAAYEARQARRIERGSKVDERA